MINTLVIYGASDDLIEIDSEHQHMLPSEEFNVLGMPGDSWTLGVSDGTLLRVVYDEDGIWRFRPLVLGSDFVRIDPGLDDRVHSDRVVLSGENLTWVLFGPYTVKSKLSNK